MMVRFCFVFFVHNWFSYQLPNFIEPFYVPLHCIVFNYSSQKVYFKLFIFYITITHICILYIQSILNQARSPAFYITTFLEQ